MLDLFRPILAELPEVYHSEFPSMGITMTLGRRTKAEVRVILMARLVTALSRLEARDA